MEKYDCNSIIFSSSCTVFGDGGTKDENGALGPISPYGRTKYMVEQILQDASAANKKLNDQDIVDTFNEKARVRAGRVAMMRGGPPPRYGGGHRKASTAASLAQGDFGDYSTTYKKGDIPVYVDNGIGGEGHYEPYVYDFVKDNIPPVPMWRAGDERHPSLS